MNRDHHTPTTRQPSPTWLRTLAADLTDQLHNRAMTLTTAGAETLITDRITTIAAALSISEHAARAYIDHTTLEAITEELLHSVADEAPGTDLLTQPPNAGLPIHAIGQLTAALGQCAHFFTNHTHTDPELSHNNLTSIAELISILGLIQSRHDTSDTITAPQALFNRIARTLTNTAALTTKTDLRRALHRDAHLAHNTTPTTPPTPKTPQQRPLT